MHIYPNQTVTQVPGLGPNLYHAQISSLYYLDIYSIFADLVFSSFTSWAQHLPVSSLCTLSTPAAAAPHVGCDKLRSCSSLDITGCCCLAVCVVSAVPMVRVPASPACVIMAASVRHTRWGGQHRELGALAGSAMYVQCTIQMCPLYKYSLSSFVRCHDT